jgi:hypothetical protein
MEWLKGIGMAGFLFFLIKGILWLTIFALLYFGVINKEQLRKFKNMVVFWRKN